MSLPEAIAQHLYKLWDETTPLAEFEQWVYAESALETLLEADDYLALIAQDYRDKEARYVLQTRLAPYLPPAELAQERGKFQVLAVLRQLKNRDRRDESTLYEVDELYCDGYRFLRVPAEYAWFWHEMEPAQRQAWLAQFDVDLKATIAAVEQAVRQGQIRFTGETHCGGLPEYEGEVPNLPPSSAPPLPKKSRWRRFWERLAR